MAEIIENFYFAGRRGCKAIYPWKEWTDGNCWKCVKGVDFKVSKRSFISAVYRHARGIGRKARTATVEDGVVFQFLP